jgi:hypothetical protein
MKHLVTLVFCALFMFTQQSLSAQCTISATNTTNGFTPTSLPCIYQGTAYGQAVNVHIPATTMYNNLTVNVDSVLLVSVTGLPAGVTVQGNPASGVIHGGQNGCLWFSGTTSALTGTYPLTFNVTIWADYQGIYSSGPVDTTLAGLGYPFSLSVCASNVPPATISPAGSDTVCQGSSVTLTANAGSGYTYRWSNTIHSTTQSISVNTSGGYVVTVYNAGDSAVSAPTTVVVGSLPAGALSVNSSSTFCQGGSVTITVPPVPDNTYHWSTNVSTPSITVQTSGDYKVTITNGYHCSIVDSQLVTVYSLPVVTWAPTDTFLCSNAALNILPAGTPAGGVFAGQHVSGDTVYNHGVTGNFWISYTYTDNNHCSKADSAYFHSTVCGGISDLGINASIALYPNPTNGILTLLAPGYAGHSYEITDQLGRSIQKKTVQSENSTIDVSNQPAGIYYLTIKNTGGNKTIRFVVQK